MDATQCPLNLSKFPRVPLGIWPTPVHRLGRLGEELSHKGLFIKRDDLTGLGMGGNKTRSLEFLLGDALKRRADTVITAGGLQSNLCALTAAACCKLGLRCLLVHNADPPSTLQGNTLLNSILGATPHFVGKLDEETRTVEMERLAEKVKLSGRNSYIIYNGASTPLGALGYVNAAFELFAQTKAQGIEIRHVGIVGAMGGTASGFVFGTALLGHPFHIHVISVEYPKPVLAKKMNELLTGVRFLIKLVQGIEPAVPPDQVMTIYDGYLGKGYAVPTRQSRQTLYKLARTEAILLEDVYTSKSLGGFLDLINEGTIPSGEGACYIHTGGLGSLFAQKIDTPGSDCPSPVQDPSP